MKKALVLGALLAVLSPAAAGASPQVLITASPNPATVGQRVIHTIDMFGGGGLEVWVSAKGFAQPGMGTLPPGSWAWECCPSQTAGTSAWHYRSATYTPAGSYRFGADARARGTFASTAQVGATSVSVWVRIV